MPAYAALLRAINLGSRNKISMPDLRRLFEEGLGADDVHTHVQSGNVVFRVPERSAAKVEAAVEKRIADDLGLDITVLVRTKAQLAKVVAASPFAAGADVSKVHVTFLVDRRRRPRWPRSMRRSSPPTSSRSSAGRSTSTVPTATAGRS